METSYIIDKERKENIAYKLEGSRFMQYCKKLCIEKKRDLLIVISSYIGFWILFGIMSGVCQWYPSQVTLSIYLVISGFGSCFVASEMFYDIVKKNNRITVLMSPVSSAHKFTARLLTVTVGYIILALIGYFIYECTNLVSLLLFHGEVSWLYSPMNIFYTYSGEFQGMAFMTVINFYLVNTSIFILGAVAWPKLSFLKTVFMLAILQIILIIVFVLLALLGLKFYPEWHLNGRTGEWFFWVFMSMGIVMTIFLTYWAYRIFRRKTLIQRL